MSDIKLNGKRILVPVNGDPATEQAFRWACHLARHSKAQIHAIHVIEVPLDLPLEEENPEAIAKSEEILGRIEAIAADEKAAGHLAVEVGSPLIRLKSVSYSSDGAPLEYFDALFRGDRSRFEVEIVDIAGHGEGNRA